MQRETRTRNIPKGTWNRVKLNSHLRRVIEKRRRLFLLINDRLERKKRERTRLS